VSIFHVRFFNPQTKMLHSSAVVDVDHPADAVKTAVDQLGNPALHSYDAGITDANGDGVAGLERALSIAQIQSRMEELQKQLENFGVKTEAPTPQNTLTAPAQPTLYTPPANQPPSSQEITSAQAPQVNSGQFTQADVDKAVADALAKAQAQSAMHG
jgi:hypothetical protein